MTLAQLLPVLSIHLGFRGVLGNKYSINKVSICRNGIQLKKKTIKGKFCTFDRLYNIYRYRNNIKSFLFKRVDVTARDAWATVQRFQSTYISNCTKLEVDNKSQSYQTGPLFRTVAPLPRYCSLLSYSCGFINRSSGLFINHQSSTHLWHRGPISGTFD